MYLSFLRPLALPRAATVQRFLSTTATIRTPRSSTTTEAAATTSAPSNPSSQAAPVATTAALPYLIKRTASNSLPIYLLRKRGGNLHQTKLRKIEGNLKALRAELQAALELGDKDVVINQLTKQIIIRGHRKPEVAKFLEERHF
ncbi:MAG: hypothetical protein M1818_003174 [Claussenomyces sp. TS43310]|nr:MAG: hypothetical protein M1818_003174 [Claussenomyces sp. TS43310]